MGYYKRIYCCVDSSYISAVIHMYVFNFDFKLYRLPKMLRPSPIPQHCIVLFVSSCLSEIVIVVEINVKKCFNYLLLCIAS